MEDFQQFLPPVLCGPGFFKPGNRKQCNLSVAIAHEATVVVVVAFVFCLFCLLLWLLLSK